MNPLPVCAFLCALSMTSGRVMAAEDHFTAMRFIRRGQLYSIEMDSG